ncbi:cytochrome P450 3A6 [Rhipicephalus sanguineus]|uniref:cytochrome P450 3A6 n=1 Tax=Rhipicephalus sanguineus TaxID=34632 RepID=UPI0020C5533C|nr:cytochrome P450 3A6 [Rhipicephalus sanguineus]
MLVMQEWIAKYGKVFGIYMGDKPHMVITDTDMIKECFIKPSKVFQDRPMFFIDAEPFSSALTFLKARQSSARPTTSMMQPMAPRRSHHRQLSMPGASVTENFDHNDKVDFTRQRDKWRELRSLFNTCFTASKVKDLFSAVDACTTEFVKKMEVLCRSGDPIDVYHNAHCLTLDTLAKTVLTWQVNFQMDEDNPTVTRLCTVFQQMDDTAIESVFAFPLLRAALRCVYPFTDFCKSMDKVSKDVLEVLNWRRGPSAPRETDVLQYLIDLQTTDDGATEKTRRYARALNDSTLLANLIMLLAVGFDSTSSSLAFLLYLLAKHPEEQEKLRAEVLAKMESLKDAKGDSNNRHQRAPSEQQAPDNIKTLPEHDPSSKDETYKTHRRTSSQIDPKVIDVTQLDDKVAGPCDLQEQPLNFSLEADDILNLERLDMVVREGLRLYPALPVMILRECAQDTTVLGQFIPRGTTLVAPPWHIHRDPNIWQNPDEFIPDRFVNQSAISSTYFPFGLGSHVCLGQRLAMLMMKTVLYKTVCEFELSLNAEDSGPLKLKVPGLLLNPVGALRVNFRPRSAACGRSL